MSLLAVGLAIVWSCASEEQGAVASHQVILKVADVDLVALGDATPLELVITASDTGQDSRGERVFTGAEATRRLYFTAVNRRGGTRTITVNWAAGEQGLRGASLRLMAEGVAPGWGVAAGEIIIGAEPQPLILGIPSCATGTGDGGVVIRYRLVVDEPASLQPGATEQVTIVFTLQDD